MARLDHNRQKKLEPQRMNIAVGQIQKLGFEPTILDSTKLKQEAFHHALFISECFNNSKEVSQLLGNNPKNPKNPKTSKKMYIFIKNHTIWN